MPLSFAFTLAPFSRSMVAADTCPLNAAACSAVVPTAPCSEQILQNSNGARYSVASDANNATLAGHEYTDENTRGKACALVFLLHWHDLGTGHSGGL